MKKKILVMTGGGTAGHVIPNLALLPFLKPHFDEIHYIGSNTGYEQRLTGGYNLIYHGIDAVKLQRGKFFAALKVPFLLMKAKSQAKKLLKEIKPDAIVSKGGYVALPVVSVSKKVPVYLHESDMSMGLSNRMCLKRCRCIFTSFESTAESIPNAVASGSPIRQKIYDGSKIAALDECGLSPANGLPFLLITGGSKGARAVNECVFEAAGELCKKFNVVHITGEKNVSPVKEKNYYSLGFTDTIEDYFALADFVISRGGSNALFELMALKKPTLVIPLPKGASRGDQIENAQYFETRKAVLVLNQQQLSDKTLLSSLENLVMHKNDLIAGMDALKNTDGTRKIAKMILNDLKSCMGGTINAAD